MKKALLTGSLIAIGCLTLSVGAVSAAVGISKTTAESTALKDAGVSRDDLIYINTTVDYDDPGKIYDVEFLTEDYAEYDYEILASNGKIISVDYDIEYPKGSRYQNGQSGNGYGYRHHDDDHHNDHEYYAHHGYNSDNRRYVNQSSADIGEAKAKEIALERAGLSASDVKYFNIKPDYDDGRLIYEGSMFHDVWEYEFEICGHTGNILDWERDHIYD